MRWLPPGNAKYLGATGLINVQKPVVGDEQSSSQAFLIIQSGPAYQLNSINVGWLVNPTLYGDGLSRITAMWTSGNNGCFNLLCPGFMQVNKDVTLTASLMGSISGGKQYEMKFIVYKKSGNWWLACGDKGDEKIGYWPGSDDEIFWGGATSSTLSGNSAPMGSGHFAEEGLTKAASIKEVGILDESHRYGPPDLKLLRFVTDSPKCYNTVASLTGVEGDTSGFFYGSPG